MPPSTLTCSQCGRTASADVQELSGWKHGELVLAGEVDAAMLLCPDCEREDRDEEYEEGGGD